MKKDHYRNVFKSDHLGIADLEDFTEEGRSLCFTIQRTVQGKHKVAGKNIECNVAYFVENIKPMVLNATNSKMVARFARSNFVQDWNNIPVELYIDPDVKMKGATVGGVRIKNVQPRMQLQIMNESHKMWTTAIQKVKEGMSIEQMRTMYQISDEDYRKLCSI